MDSFAPSRGLRQGDPLSPFLFLFVADGLSALLHHATQIGRIAPLRVCRRAPGISHLLFADDTLLFLRADPDEAASVLDIIHSYEKGTVQLINPAKCFLFFGKSCPDAMQQAIRDVLHVVDSEFESKHLGLPTPEGRINRGKFQNLQAKLQKRLL